MAVAKVDGVSSHSATKEGVKYVQVVPDA